MSLAETHRLLNILVFIIWATYQFISSAKNIQHSRNLVFSFPCSVVEPLIAVPCEGGSGVVLGELGGIVGIGSKVDSLEGDILASGDNRIVVPVNDVED